MARLSRQAGEEGAERRRVELEKKMLHEKLLNVTAELEKTKQNLVNSEAKVILNIFDFYYTILISTLLICSMML